MLLLSNSIFTTMAQIANLRQQGDASGKTFAEDRPLGEL